MPSKWIDRQIDEVLLTTAMSAGFLYARRRARRILPKVVVGGAVVTALGAAAAATAAGVGVLGLAGGAAAWYRHRSKAGAPATDWHPAGAGGPPATTFGSNSGDAVVKDTESKPSTAK
jgi:hypothetical protein